MFNTSLEAMQVAVRSKLGAQLDALWQTVIDYRDHELADIDNYKVRYNKVRDFFHNNCAHKFMDIVWNMTGLWITDVKYVELFDSGFCTMIYIGNNMDQVGTLQIENILNGDWTSRYWNARIPDDLTAEQLVKIANSYDLIKGSIKKEQRDEIKKLVRSRIGFDIRTGFLLEDFLPKNSGVSNFTAQEITAIILHELGHTLTLVEHAADMYARASTFNYLTTAFQAAHGGDASAAVSLVNEAAKALDSKGNKDAASKIRKLGERFNIDMVKAGSNADPKIKRKLVSGLIISIIYLISDALIAPFDFLFGNNVRFKYNASEQKRKYGDLPANGRLLTWQERKADEYAFTHGYGKDQVTALEKLGRLFNRLGRSESEIEKINSIETLGKDISFFDKMHLLLVAPMICGDYMQSLYPAGSQRFKELLNLTVQQLKANGANPEMVRKYMEDIEVIKDKIDHIEKSDLFLARMVKAYEVLNSYLSIPSFFDIIVHGRVRQELDRLIDELQDLSCNLIHFYGMKLQSLAKKGK